jgi:uncharacterized protein (UPF0276 family)
MSDRVGLGWRPELSAGILAHLDAIEALEVIADDWLDRPRRELQALRSLARERPLWLHGVSLGLASTVPVARVRLERLARLVDSIEPTGWSEHLAFVRGGGLELGHLAAPPRCRETVAGAAENAELAARVVGSRPMLENVATLIDPPGSDLDEPTWLVAALAAADAPLLLDLHNLHANAVNIGFDAAAALARLPLGRVGMVHVAGGRWIGGARRRLLDDHLHPAPEPVWALLEQLASLAPQPLTVILERDGAYPEMPALLDELDRARAALRAGRMRAEAA